ncbi:MAG: pseudaminic acid cytidylyltransferase [Flavobacterium sp.]|nr:MAG: pseudaminic acid cytidylyltransferase [Flavobacterium sp.]
MANLCIIPARGGSKRIPRKNIKDFLGKPIIAYSIAAALKSAIFDEVMVSTDDEEIAEIAKMYGASVPFLRSVETANDFATTMDVIVEVIDTYQQKGDSFEHVCCLYSCAPFVNEVKIKEGFDILTKNNFDTVFPVLPFGTPIQRALSLEDSKLSFKNPEFEVARSQDLKEHYHDAGQFYWLKEGAIKMRKIVNENTGAIVLSELEAQDIDNEIDWKIAELKYTLLNDK